MLTATCTSAMAQKPHNRHNPQITNTTQQADTSEVIAYSDTTTADTSMTTTTPDNGMNGQWEQTSADLIDTVHDPFKLIACLTTLGVGGVIVAIFFILLCLLVIFSPIILIAIIMYLIYKRRRQHYQLIEKAMETNSEIPEELIRQEHSGYEAMWSKGIRNISIGVGILVFALCIEEEVVAGIAGIILFYGVGQAVIARTLRKKDNGGTDETDYNI